MCNEVIKNIIRQQKIAKGDVQFPVVQDEVYNKDNELQADGNPDTEQVGATTDAE